MGTEETTDTSAVSIIFERVGAVVDPCALTNGTGLTLGDLGMIDSVTVVDGVVQVALLLDDPICLYSVGIRAAVTEAAQSVPGVAEVHISHATDRLWDPDRITAPARARMDGWRKERIERAGIGSRMALALAPLAQTPARDDRRIVTA